MAKLNGVQVIDATNGEVTKISYEGAEYERVEGQPEVGDIAEAIQRVNGIGVGEFAKVDDIDIDGDPIIVPRGPYFGARFNFYRKASADQSPSLGDRVSTLEADVAELKGEADNYVRAVKCLDERKDGLTGFGKSGQGLVKIGAIGELIEKTDGGVFVKFDKSDVNRPRFDEYQRFFLRDGEYEFVAQPEVTTQYAIDAREQYRKVTREPKVGDYVKFSVAPTSDVTADKFYEVTFVDTFDDPYITDDEGGEFDTCGHGYELYERVDDDKVELKVGDYAKVTNGNEIYNKTGDIVKVVLDDGSNWAPLEVEHLDGSYGGFKGRHNLTPATDEEIAQAKAEAAEVSKWTKIGRKPNEFKEGDIVRVKWLYKKGDVNELVEIERGPIGPSGGGNYYLTGGEGTLGRHITELITPVESRFDKAAE